MVDVRRHYRLTWGGTSWGTEIWSMGLNLISPIDVPLAVMDQFCKDGIADVTNDVKTWWGVSGGCGAGQTYHLEWVKFNSVGEDGKQHTNPTVQAAVSPAITPAAFAPLGGQALPQIALVLSLSTGLRGKRGVRGRVYLPAAQYTMVSANSPYIDSSALSNIAGKFKTFLNNVNDWPGVDGDSPEVAVVSQVSDIAHSVTGIRVGNVHDTQRSRRSAIKETYTELSLT